MGNLIKKVQLLEANQAVTQQIVSSYIEFHGDESKFKKFIEDKKDERKNNNKNTNGSPKKK